MATGLLIRGQCKCLIQQMQNCFGEAQMSGINLGFFALPLEKV
ncbi:hypothetical protein S7335_868 [Synechococcus sp. PCC 7335]|nr:hypothetical protein S7335_868 [Synechococcus sp. PCC 7335]